MSPTLLVAGIGSVAAALLLLALVVIPPGRSRVPLSRLDPSVVPSASALAGAGAAAGAAVEKVLARRGRLAAGAAALERAGMSTTLPNFVVTVGLGTIVGGLLGFVISGPFLGVLMLVAVPFGAKLFLRFRAGRRQAAFADQLDDSLQLMAGSLRAGHSLLRAVDSVSQEAAAPTSEEFSRIVNETRVGRDLNDALDEVAARMGSDDFVWVAQAIAIRRQVKALSAEGKLSAVVLMALPFGVTGFIS